MVPLSFSIRNSIFFTSRSYLNTYFTRNQQHGNLPCCGLSPPLLICPVDDPVFRPLFSILFYYLVSVCTLSLGTPLRLRAFWLRYYQVYMYVVFAFRPRMNWYEKVFRGQLLCLADTISCVIYMTTYREVGVVICRGQGFEDKVM